MIGCSLLRPSLRAQHMFLDFPGGGLRQFCENDMAWQLEGRQMLAREIDEFLRRCRHAWFQFHKGAGCFALVLIAFRHHRDHSNRWMLIERIFHFDAADILPA